MHVVPFYSINLPEVNGGKSDNRRHRNNGHNQSIKRFNKGEPSQPPPQPNNGIETVQSTRGNFSKWQQLEQKLINQRLGYYKNLNVNRITGVPHMSKYGHLGQNDEISIKQSAKNSLKFMYRLDLKEISNDKMATSS